MSPTRVRKEAIAVVRRMAGIFLKIDFSLITKLILLLCIVDLLCCVRIYLTDDYMKCGPLTRSHLCMKIVDQQRTTLRLCINQKWSVFIEVYNKCRSTNMQLPYHLYYRKRYMPFKVLL
jgi:hypothetical protein